MKLTALRLRNFRSFEEATFTFAPRLNLIVGPNGVGKSNLMEAIYLLIIGRSFRSANLRDLVRVGSDGFFLEGLFEKRGVMQKVRYGFDGERRRILINDTLCSSTAQLLGHLQGVLLAPGDDELVGGAPALRRHYLDMQLAQVDPLFVHHLTRYTRAHRQRNTLLRSRRTEAMEVWEEEMARSGAYVRLLRERLVGLLSERGSVLFRELHAMPVSFELAYRGTPSCEGLAELEARYRELLRVQRPRELDRGFSAIGPHRDDLDLHLDGHPAKIHASEGQKRLLVAALKGAEWECVAERAEGFPLMLADDLAIGLDSVHTERFIQRLFSMGQVFATTPEVSLDLPAESVVHTLGCVEPTL